MSARFVLLLMLMLALAGCATAPEPTPAPTPAVEATPTSPTWIDSHVVTGQLPPAWELGAPLWATFGTSAHDHAQQRELALADGELAAPARCVAYRTNESWSTDTCDVEVEGDRWSLWVRWAGCVHPPQDSRACYPESYVPFTMRVVAFTASGSVAAGWNGTMAPNVNIIPE